MRQLFSRTRRYTWPPAWRHQVDGVLWTFRISTNGRIVGEVRHPVRREASFFCLDESDGRVLWKDLRFDEPWWIGMEDMDGDRVFFHRYRKPDMPQHLGIMAVGLHDGRLLWQNPDVSFLFADHGLVYAAKQGFESMRYSALDAGDGTLRRDFGTDGAAVQTLRDALVDIDRFRGYRYPEPFAEDDPEFAEHRELVHGFCRPADLRGNLDVMRIGSLLLAGWHAPTARSAEDTLEQQFLAYDLDRSAVVFCDTINTSVAHPSIDSFFVKDRTVYYVKNLDTLTAHTLTDDWQP